MLNLQKNNSFLSFHSPIFHSKIHKYPACKMNKDEQQGGGGGGVGAGQKLEVLVDILFESLFAATKIYILMFNLTHSLISLMDSFHFTQWKVFFPMH